MCLYRDLADVGLATDLFIQQAGDYQRHDLPFARGERRVTVPERPYLRLASKCSGAALDGLPDGAQQHVVAKWLEQDNTERVLSVMTPGKTWRRSEIATLSNISAEDAMQALLVLKYADKVISLDVDEEPKGTFWRRI